jgi:fructose-bisphosphate aldolase class II
MPVANFEQYSQMLEKAYAEKYAYPAINVSSLTTANAALAAFAELGADGIIQVSTGGGKFASGTALNDMVLGAHSIAEHIHRAAEKLDILIAIHTDHCPPDHIDSFLLPLIAISEKRVEKGALPLFSSHMLDASGLPLKENMDLCVPVLERMAQIGQILEVEAGVVGGEEDGAAGSDDTPSEKLYTSPEDMVYVYEALSSVKDARYMFAATFGNVHGSYKPGVVKLTPSILKEGQDAVRNKFGEDAHFWLVFHGGSGSDKSDILETLDYGVVKMNVDTDCQYAFTKAIAEHIFTNYNEVLKIDGEVGNKKKYDPRSYLKQAELSMKERVQVACRDLRCENKSILKA